MVYIRKNLCRAFALCLLGVSAAMGQSNPVNTNLLNPSGDLAGWRSGWTAGYGCSLDSKATGGGPRVNALRQNLPADFTSGNHSWHMRVPVAAGAKYRFSVKYQLKDVGAAFAQFHFIYPDGTLMPYLNFRESSPTVSGTQEGVWQELETEFTAPAGAAAVRVALRLNSSGTVWWSDPVMTRTTAPSDVSFNELAQGYDLRDSVGIVVRQLPIDKLLPLNARWTRYNINWSAIEYAGKDQWDTAKLDHMVEEIRAAKEAGIETMVSLGYSPRWAGRKNEGVRAGNVIASDLRDWQHYVAVVVGRLGGLVDHYRIMNEVNHQWDTGAQPQEYAEFLKTAYTTIKTINPEATVIMAGVSGTPGGYLQGIYDAGAGDFFDIGACQPYIQGRHSPEEGRLVERLQAYRMAMASNGDDSPIWATEYGYPSEPLDRISFEEQAGLYVRSHLLALGSGAGITKFFFYLLRNEEGDTISQTGGMYTKDWEMKPLGIAVGALATVINPVTAYVGEVDLGNDEQEYNRLFVREDGTHTWALWRISGQSDKVLEFAEPVELIAWDGTSLGVGRRHEVSLGHLPHYVVGPMADIAAKARRPSQISFASVGSALEHQTVPVPWQGQLGEGFTFELVGKRNPDSGVVATANVNADAEGLWIRADIDDTSPAQNTVKGFNGVWVQDSVEVFLNLEPENAPAGFITNACYHFIATPGVGGQDARVYWADQGVRSVQKVIGDSRIRVTPRADGSGYVFEFFIPWQEWLEGGAPAKGERIGFDLYATRSNAAGAREETAVWFGDLDGQDASMWGTIRLGEKE